MAPTIRTADASPNAASLIEGLRDFGYNLETSLADIIDNAISAGAEHVQILVDSTCESPWIAIVDNGKGMNEGELIEAMRLGSRNPREDRERHDLGRFGLGLKSASFSQCRSLSVVSRKEGQTNCAAWNLDKISRSNKWEIDLLDDPKFPAIDSMSETGTAVIWQQLDRLDGGYFSDVEKRSKTINEALTKAERHLRIVFHRFLEGSTPRIKLSLNNRLLTPIDPFASDNPARQADPVEDLVLKNETIRIRCITLPHMKKMTKDEWEEIGGPGGHLKSQGLYVYRQDRLIIAGSWLGLAKATELTKLCRVCVDIPNSMDAEWKIDVKKASAQLPPLVKQRLKLVVERFVGTSKRTYRRRGRAIVEEQRLPMWNRTKKDSGVVFAPNIEHPVFLEFQELLTASQQDAFINCLDLLGSSLPIETLYADMMGAEGAVQTAPISETALRQQIEALVPDLLEKKIPASNISDVLKGIDTLSKNWTTAEPIILEILSGD